MKSKVGKKQCAVQSGPGTNNAAGKSDPPQRITRVGVSNSPKGNGRSTKQQ